MGKIRWNVRCEVCKKFFINNIIVKRKCPKCREEMLNKLGFKDGKKKE